MEPRRGLATHAGEKSVAAWFWTSFWTSFWASLAALLVLSAPIVARADEPARIAGRLRLDLAGASLDVVGPIVVYLEALDDQPIPAPPAEHVEIKQQNARFSPSFRAITAGQTVDMPNFDVIYHNVFSYSGENAFDLGTYPAGESHAVTFDHPGIVKAYCSIHERMSATIFVAPNPWYAVAGASGDYVIEGVPPGRYAIRTWAERLPPTEHAVTLMRGQQVDLDVSLGQIRP